MSHAAAAPTAPDTPTLDPHRLDCYRVALEFCTLAARSVPRGHRELRDQLTRASLSVPLNVAEGCGRCSPCDKARFFAIARVDCLRSLGLIPIAKANEAQWLLVRIVQMLTRLGASEQRERSQARDREARSGGTAPNGR